MKRRHVLERIRASVFGTLITAMFGATPAFALVIDNFEQGTFNLAAQDGGSNAGAQGGLSVFNCIASVRDTRITSFGGGPAGATLNLSNLDDEVATVMPDNGGALQLLYDILAATDITLGGNLDRIRINLSVAPTGASVGEIRLAIRDIFGNEQSVNTPFFGPGSIDVFYSDYPLVDLASTEWMGIVLTAFGVGDYHVRDIRAIEVGTSTITWNPLTEGSEGPPYPASSLLWRGAAEDESGMPLPAGMVDFTLADAMPGDPCEPFCDGIPYRVVTGMPAEPGQLVETELWWNGDPDDFLPDESNIRLNLRIAGDLAEAGEEVHRDLVYAGPDGFAVEIGVHWLNAASEPVAHGLYRLVGELLQNDVATITQTRVFDPFETGADVDFCLMAGQPRVGPRRDGPEEPIIVFRFEGTTTPIDSQVSVPEGLAMPGGLVAYPSIMRAGTTFQLNAVDARDRTIGVYDAHGRQVRAISVSGGASEVRWDGRDATGRAAGAGVYFVRLQGAHAAERTRVVILP